MKRSGAAHLSYKKHVVALATESARSENLKQQRAARRNAGFVRDLVAVRSPIAARRDATMEAQQLARDIVAGRLTIAEARAQMRGAA